MKQEEKAQQSLDKILSAAMEEFSSRSYAEASLNNICAANDISKGLIYHYFGSKDELYLRCVKQCLDKFKDYLAQESYDFSDFQRGMNQYMERRQRFFEERPLEGRLFFNTVMKPPVHLEGQLLELRREFDGQALGYYRDGLSQLELRQGVTEKMALDYFVMLQEIFNGYFQRHISDGAEPGSLLREHEESLSTLLKLMLYGIAKEQTP